MKNFVIPLEVGLRYIFFAHWYASLRCLLPILWFIRVIYSILLGFIVYILKRTLVYANFVFVAILLVMRSGNHNNGYFTRLNFTLCSGTFLISAADL